MLKTKTKTNSNYVKIHSLFDKITKQKNTTLPLHTTNMQQKYIHLTKA